MISLSHWLAMVQKKPFSLRSWAWAGSQTVELSRLSQSMRMIDSCWDAHQDPRVFIALRLTPCLSLLIDDSPCGLQHTLSTWPQCGCPCLHCHSPVSSPFLSLTTAVTGWRGQNTAAGSPDDAEPGSFLSLSPATLPFEWLYLSMHTQTKSRSCL